MTSLITLHQPGKIKVCWWSGTETSSLGINTSLLRIRRSIWRDKGEYQGWTILQSWFTWRCFVPIQTVSQTCKNVGIKLANAENKHWELPKSFDLTPSHLIAWKPVTILKQLSENNSVPPASSPITSYTISLKANSWLSSCHAHL